MTATLPLRQVRLPKSRSASPYSFEVEHLTHAVVVVRVHGEVACEQAHELNEQLRSSLMSWPQFVILDLAKVRYVGPLALETLAELSRDVSQQGGEVWLTGLQQAVWLALHAAGLDRLFAIRTSLAQALAS
jgi:anti-anti-sigma factor